MKIVHVTEAWNGGISTYVNTLLEHQAAGHDVTLIYSINQTNADFDSIALKNLGVKLHPYQSSRNPRRFLSIARKIRRILNSIQPDVVHLHSTFPGVYGRIFKTYPIVYCAHGWSFVQEEGRLKKAVYSAVEKFFLRNTSAIINISNHEQGAALGLKPGKVISEVIYTGVKDKAPSQTPASKLNLDPTCINAVFVGRLDYKKGFDLIEGFFNSPSLKGVKLSVIGQSRRDGVAVEMADTANITYLGWVDNKDIDTYLKQFDVVIIPSRYEGFGLVAVEAMRNSKPVIVSNSGALPELVQEGVNGYVFDLNHVNTQLGKIFKSTTKAKLKAMGEKGRALYLEKFNVKRFVADTQKLYERVLYKA